MIIFRNFETKFKLFFTFEKYFFAVLPPEKNLAYFFNYLYGKILHLLFMSRFWTFGEFLSIRARLMQ